MPDDIARDEEQGGRASQRDSTLKKFNEILKKNVRTKPYYMILGIIAFLCIVGIIIKAIAPNLEIPTASYRLMEPIGKYSAIGFGVIFIIGFSLILLSKLADFFVARDRGEYQPLVRNIVAPTSYTEVNQSAPSPNPNDAPNNIFGSAPPLRSNVSNSAPDDSTELQEALVLHENVDTSLGDLYGTIDNIKWALLNNILPTQECIQALQTHINAAYPILQANLNTTGSVNLIDTANNLLGALNGMLNIGSTSTEENTKSANKLLYTFEAGVIQNQVAYIVSSSDTENQVAQLQVLGQRAQRLTQSPDDGSTNESLLEVARNLSNALAGILDIASEVPTDPSAAPAPVPDQSVTRTNVNISAVKQNLRHNLLSQNASKLSLLLAARQVAEALSDLDLNAAAVGNEGSATAPGAVGDLDLNAAAVGNEGSATALGAILPVSSINVTDLSPLYRSLAYINAFLDTPEALKQDNSIYTDPIRISLGQFGFFCNPLRSQAPGSKSALQSIVTQVATNIGTIFGNIHMNHTDRSAYREYLVYIKRSMSELMHSIDVNEPSNVLANPLYGIIRVLDAEGSLGISGGTLARHASMSVLLRRSMGYAPLSGDIPQSQENIQDTATTNAFPSNGGQH